MAASTSAGDSLPAGDFPGASASQPALFTALALALSALHFGLFFETETPIRTDVRYFLYFAWQIAEGAVPHLDLFDNKTFLSSLLAAGIFRLGEILGQDPLQAIRISTLGLSAFGGLLSFWIFRRLSRGSTVAGFLGLAAFGSFGILGELPAIGNFPKLLMVVLASAMALAVARRAWFAAGACSALAFLDWQVGGLVGLAAFVAALASGEHWARNTLRLIGGALVGILPLILYFAANGALGAAVEQTFAMALARAAESTESVSTLDRIARFGWTTTRMGLSERFLLAISLLGLPLSWLWLRREGSSAAGRLLLPLCVYHTAILGFSLVDFQRFPDFYVLMATAAFWLGIVWTRCFAALSRHHAFGATAAATAILVVAVAFGRPFFLRPETNLTTAHVPASVTLSEQRAVARALRERLAGQPFVALASAEILFLMRHRNPLDIVYLNVPSHRYHALDENESIEATAARLVEGVEPQAFVWPGRYELAPRLANRYARVEIAVPDGEYVVRFYERK